MGGTSTTVLRRWIHAKHFFFLINIKKNGKFCLATQSKSFSKDIYSIIPSSDLSLGKRLFFFLFSSPSELAFHNIFLQ